MYKKEKGFTLIEMLIVVVIIGVLSSIVLPRITGNAKDAKDKACSQQIASINSTVELMMFEQSYNAPGTVGVPAAFPGKGITASPAWDTASVFTDYFPDGGMSCPVNTATTYTLANGRVIVGTHVSGGAH